MPPPPGTAAAQANPGHHHATIEKRANITSLAGTGGGLAVGAAAGATISAKPQIINPKAEVTRFVPTALRVRRDKSGAIPGAAPGPLEKLGVGGRKGDEGLGGGSGGVQSQKQHAAAAQMGLIGTTHKGSGSQPSMKTKDQVYEAFMREMEGLL